MSNDAIKALWLALLVGVMTGLAMRFQIDAPRLTDEQIEAPRLTDEQIEQWR